ncbi:MAG: hypothetical protein V4658_14015 [Bacteroidota bacterium]
MLFITHDIDWISPLHPYSLAKVFTHGKKWIGLSKVIQPDIFIRHIEKLVSFNQSHQVNAIWLSGAPQKHSFQKFGLRYTADCPSYKTALNMLLEAGCEIGLHSVNTESFARQTIALSELTRQPIHYHRSHYLKFDENSLFKNLQQQHIKTDFSLGNARKIDLPSQMPVITYGINCVPTLLFDNAFFFNDPKDVLHQFKQKINEANMLKQDVAILFHPENFAVNPALWDYYEEVISIVEELS